MNNKKQIFLKITHSFYFQLAIAVAVTFLFIAFIGHPTRVSGESMYPTLIDGQLTFINKLDKSFDRNDIVMLYYEEEGIAGKVPVVKRIIGLPGEEVQILDGKIYINNKLYEGYEGEEIEDAGVLSKPLILGNNQYCVLGDNRNNSKDSTEVGSIKEENIVGTVVAKFHDNQ